MKHNAKVVSNLVAALVFQVVLLMLLLWQHESGLAFLAGLGLVAVFAAQHYYHRGVRATTILRLLDAQAQKHPAQDAARDPLDAALADAEAAED